MKMAEKARYFPLSLAGNFLITLEVCQTPLLTPQSEAQGTFWTAPKCIPFHQVVRQKTMWTNGPVWITGTAYTKPELVHVKHFYLYKIAGDRAEKQRSLWSGTKLCVWRWCGLLSSYNFIIIVLGMRGPHWINVVLSQREKYSDLEDKGKYIIWISI